ncbi:hypothetical protein WA026_011790 [Henosepilachna vigintioctopunctata]|uniref:Uncharacterized protein n=1 Tax=Henosepilachna vigintioctopunctata TaxID=420089 RepID=A0AAW1UIQ0_9CUCU
MSSSPIEMKILFSGCTERSRRYSYNAPKATASARSGCGWGNCELLDMVISPLEAAHVGDTTAAIFQHISQEKCKPTKWLPFNKKSRIKRSLPVRRLFLFYTNYNINEDICINQYITNGCPLGI